MIVLLTGNYKGGIFQFACQIEEEIKKLGKETVLYMPSNSEDKTDSKYLYRRKNSLNPFSKYYNKIADSISVLNPELVFVCDSDLVTARIALGVKRSIPLCMCVHDAKPHPNYKTVVRYIKEMVKRPYIHAAWRIAKKIVVMSENTKNQMTQLYPFLNSKLGVISLGAHPPKGHEIQPDEIKNKKPYYLFFGRIDKYKGINNLLMAYVKNIDKKPYDLIIAGEGTLTDTEKELISQHSNRITLIKRYISNDEMIWLFRYARCVVLPYVEASQSGVLSMAYYFGKSVIASDLEGLKEFVDIGKTGLIFENLDQFEEYLTYIDRLLPENVCAINEYVEKNLNWSVNIRRCLQEFL